MVCAAGGVAVAAAVVVCTSGVCGVGADGEVGVGRGTDEASGVAVVLVQFLEPSHHWPNGQSVSCVHIPHVPHSSGHKSSMITA